ncbi:MAG: CBS domain-containing protein [Candidatus Limnocylindria bacterium]
MTEQRLAALTVGELMTYDPILVREDEPLTHAAGLIEQHRIHGLPVVDETGSLVGVVSQTDMLRARTTEHLWSAWRGLKVRHLMTAPALTIETDATVEQAAARMEQNQVHRLVVVEAGRPAPIGIISTSDIVRAMAAQAGPEPEEVGR